MMLVIICLSVVSISMLIVLATWYIRYMRHGPKANTSNTGTSESSLPESPDDHHFNLKYDQFESSRGSRNYHYQPHHWTASQIYPSQQYPLLQHHQLWSAQHPPPPQKVTFRSASQHEILENTDNQYYEVPFSHLLPTAHHHGNSGPYHIGSVSSVNNFQDHFSTTTPPFGFAGHHNMHRSTSMRTTQQPFYNT